MAGQPGVGAPITAVIAGPPQVLVGAAAPVHAVQLAAVDSQGGVGLGVVAAEQPVSAPTGAVEAGPPHLSTAPVLVSAVQEAVEGRQGRPSAGPAVHLGIGAPAGAGDRGPPQSLVAAAAAVHAVQVVVVDGQGRAVAAEVAGEGGISTPSVIALGIVDGPPELVVPVPAVH